MQTRAEKYDPIATVNMMLEDPKAAPETDSPTAYWRPLARQMVQALRTEEIESFRRSTAKGLLAFGARSFAPNRDANSRFWMLHDILVRTPVLSSLAKRYEEHIRRGYDAAKGQSEWKQRLLYELLKQRDGSLTAMEDLLIGRPLTIEIEGRPYSENFLFSQLFYSEIAERLDFARIETVLEIGPGYGSLAEIVLRRNPATKYVLCDIVPTLLYSDYYMNRLLGDQAARYKETRELKEIDPRSSDARRSYSVANFDLTKIVGPIDLFINKASFQEMTVEVVAHYGAVIKALDPKYVFLFNSDRDNPRTRPGLDTAFYVEVFRDLTLVEQWRDYLFPGYAGLLFQGRT